MLTFRNFVDFSHQKKHKWDICCQCTDLKCDILNSKAFITNCFICTSLVKQLVINLWNYDISLTFVTIK